MRSPVMVCALRVFAVESNDGCDVLVLREKLWDAHARGAPSTPVRSTMMLRALRVFAVESNDDCHVLVLRVGAAASVPEIRELTLVYGA